MSITTDSLLPLGKASSLDPSKAPLDTYIGPVGTRAPRLVDTERSNNSVRVPIVSGMGGGTTKARNERIEDDERDLGSLIERLLGYSPESRTGLDIHQW